ncbi:putative integral membrane protein, Mpv17/PMP22 family [Aureobasidium subglaciale]|nr:putative integral membrane protein, Mpv17/PMP22 family [Aureobasidium subglaciale]
MHGPVGSVMTAGYGTKLAQRPMLTQSVTTAVLFATGDTMAQQGVEKVGLKNHDLARSGRMALYGGAVFGPLATTWFGFLQRRVRIPSSPNMEILARVGLDQAILAPTNLFVFLSSMAIMEGSDPSKKIESTYWNALSKNWMLWPFVQAVNFKFVPLHHRVLVVNVVSLGWNCYLSYLNSTGSPIPKELPPS